MSMPLSCGGLQLRAQVPVLKTAVVDEQNKSKTLAVSVCRVFSRLPGRVANRDECVATRAERE
jgi:hypothetical protein